MRIALSAFAASSGLILLCVAFLGRPDVYIHWTQQEVAALFQTGPVEDTAGTGSEALAHQVALLQQQVTQLKGQLAGRSPSGPDSGGQTSVAQAASAPLPQSHVLDAPSLGGALPLPQSQPPALGSPQFPSPPAGHVPLPSERADTQTSLVVTPERHEVVRPTGASTARSKNEPPSPKIEADDTQSVLARLRQHTATATPPVANPVAAEPPNLEPARQRLMMARTALLNGSIDDARRILQEVQLRLVFRPVTPDNSEPAVPGPSASDVAHALAALGDNDTRHGLQFIERAMSDLAASDVPSGASTPALSATGYAPPYPQY